MRISKELITQFQEIYASTYGNSLSFGDAEFELNELANLIRITSRKYRNEK